MYEVIWTPYSEEQLAELWLSSKKRDAIRSAAFNIDEQLKRDPRSIGGHVKGNFWSIGYGPLAVLFDIVEDDKRVHVWNVWHFDQQRN